MFRCGMMNPMHDQTTISVALSQATELLRQASPTARLDAELLLAHALGYPRAHLLAEGRQELTSAHLETFRALVARRSALEPVAYITGRREFYGLDFLVDPRVLVPRPETELLVELALAWTMDDRRWTMEHGIVEPQNWANSAIPRTKNREPTIHVQHHVSSVRTSDEGQRTTDGQPSSIVHGPRSITIADIGTGSGCIAVALAANLPEARIIAVDLSPDALDVTRLNVERHGVQGRVQLRQGDLLAPLDGPVDLIASNPPYTVLTAIDEGVRRHEPHLALDGGPDGLDLYRRLLEQAPGFLKPNGVVLLEIGAEQGQAVAALALAAFPGAIVTVHQDLAGLDRVVSVATG
jgi:release factor glutamine methyltransferase